MTSEDRIDLLRRACGRALSNLRPDRVPDVSNVRAARRALEQALDEDVPALATRRLRFSMPLDQDTAVDVEVTEDGQCVSCGQAAAAGFPVLRLRYANAHDPLDWCAKCITASLAVRLTASLRPAAIQTVIEHARAHATPGDT